MISMVGVRKGFWPYKNFAPITPQYQGTAGQPRVISKMILNNTAGVDV